MDTNTAPQLDIAETAEGFNQRISMDTKGTIHPASKGSSYVFVICDAFTHFVVTKPASFNDDETAANVSLEQSIINFGPPNILVTDKGTEHFKNITTNRCNLFGIKNRPRYPKTPWANSLVESQKENISPFIRMKTQQNIIHWSDKAEIYTFAHNTQTLTNLPFRVRNWSLKKNHENQSNLI